MLLRGTDLVTKINSKRELKVVARLLRVGVHPWGFWGAIILVPLFDPVTAAHI